jgi:Ca2+-binding RTX toxin-like protein
MAAMAQMSDQYLQLNEDGTPRRKHDIEEKKERRPVLFSFGGFAFFSALAMIKNIWFGEDDLRAHDHGRSGPRLAEPPKDGSISDGDLVVASHPELGTPADPQETQKGTHSDYIRGSGLNFSLSVLDLNFSDTGAISTARLGAPLAPPMNDNIRLYGATPGAPIILPNEVRGGAGGGGGGGGDGTSESGEGMQGGSPGGQGGGTPNAGGGTTGGSSVNPGGNSGSGGSTGSGSGSGGTSGNNGSSGSEGTSGNGSPGSGGTTGSTGTGGGSSGASDPRQTNRLPTVSNVVLLSTLLINEARSLEHSELLTHASDADGDVLQITNIKASAGHVVATANGGWLYIPQFNDKSVVELTFEINDGEGAVAQKAYLPIAALPHAPLNGTDQPDDLTVSSLDDVVGRIVDAGGGNDTITTGAGDDVVYAGAGDDIIRTGAGNDVIFAGTGDDLVEAGSGDDIIHGEAGNDDLRGEAGNDRIYGGDGEDLLSGGDGNDILVGGTGNDQIDGGADNDRIIAETGDGDDTVVGGDGDDTYVSAASDGHDLFAGMDGHDVFIAVEIGDGDIFDGGVGTDTYDATAIESALIVDLTAGTVTLIEVADSNQSDPAVEVASLTDPAPDTEIALTTLPSADPEIAPTTLISVENVIGGSANDVFIANDEVSEFTGGDGEDLFVFQTVASSGVGSGGRDKILDFEVGDRIKIDDISDEFAVDFNATFEDPGIRKFVLIGQGQDFTRPGEVRFKYDEEAKATVLEGNVDFDTDAEFHIEILGVHDLKYDSYVYST